MLPPRAQSVPPGRSMAPTQAHGSVSHPLGMYAGPRISPRASRDQQLAWESPRSGHARDSGRLVRRNVGRPRFQRAHDSASTLGGQTPSSLRSQSPVSLRDDSSCPKRDHFPARPHDTERYLVWMPSLYRKNFRYSWTVADEIGQPPQREPRSPLDEMHEQQAQRAEPSSRHRGEACGVQSMPSVLKPARGRPILSRPTTHGDKAAHVLPALHMPSKPYMIFITGQSSVGTTESQKLPPVRTQHTHIASADESSETDIPEKPWEGSLGAVVSGEEGSKGSAAPENPKIKIGTHIPTAADFSPSNFDYGASPTTLEYYYRTVVDGVQEKEAKQSNDGISAPDIKA